MSCKLWYDNQYLHLWMLHWDDLTQTMFSGDDPTREENMVCRGSCS